MRTLKLIAASAFAVMAVACSSASSDATASADSLKTSQDLKPSKALVDSASYLLGVNYGMMLKQYGMNPDYNAMVKGMKDFVNAEGRPGSEGFVDQFKYSPELLNEVINKYIGALREYESALNAEQSKAFFESNGKKNGVVTTESGLQYEILEAGNDVKPGAADTVSVYYKGTLLDGTVFDETSEGSEPATLTLNRVIPGWTEGLQLIGEGGKIKLYIPSELGYGPRASGPIPANSTLIFEVSLESVKPVATESAE